MAIWRVPALARVDLKKLVGTPEGEDLENNLIRMGCNRLYKKP